MERAVKSSDVLSYSSSAKDIIQYERLKAYYAAEEIYLAERTGTALAKDDITHRAASYLSKEQLAGGRAVTFRGDDGTHYVLLQTEGKLNGYSGIYEYVLNNAGKVTHQRFISGGEYTGMPNQKVPKGGY